MRGLRWSGKRRGDMAVAAQILCAVELCGRAARVWRRRLRVEMGLPGFKEGAGDLGGARPS